MGERTGGGAGETGSLLQTSVPGALSLIQLLTADDLELYFGIFRFEEDEEDEYYDE